MTHRSQVTMAPFCVVKSTRPRKKIGYHPTHFLGVVVGASENHLRTNPDTVERSALQR